MFMRVPVEQLGRSQILFRFSELDGGLSYDVKPLTQASPSNATTSSAPPHSSLVGVDLNFQTIFDEEGRGRGLCVSATIPLGDHFNALHAGPSSLLNGNSGIEGFAGHMPLDETFSAPPTNGFTGPFGELHDGSGALPAHMDMSVFSPYDQLDSIMHDFSHEFQSVFDNTRFPPTSSIPTSDSSAAPTPNSFYSPKRLSQPLSEPGQPLRRLSDPGPLPNSAPSSASAPSPSPSTSTSISDAPAARPPTKTRRKRYQCQFPDCDRMLTSEYTRRVHMTTHTKTRKSIPCTIPGCNEHFSRMHDRLRHEVTQHGKVCEFSCQVCKRFFSSAKFLASHKCPEKTGPTRWPATGDGEEE